MHPDELLGQLKDWGVLKEGHFLLTSGRHSSRFLLFARAFEYPERGSWLAQRLAVEAREFEATVVCGPAMGGVLLSYEVARALSLRTIYTEKDGDAMALKRGFAVQPDDRVLVVEDAVTTGGSVRQTITALRRAGAEIAAVAAVVDRSGGSVDFGVPFCSLTVIDVPSYDAAECPECKIGMPLQRPKS